jgi:hypothetical protein
MTKIRYMFRLVISHLQVNYSLVQPITYSNECALCDPMWLTVIEILLTLSLLMSCIYGAPCKARNFNVVYIWTYVWQR